MIISENTAANFAPCPAGTFLARCVRLLDLGTQTTDYQGETKTAHKVLLAFEILDADVRRDDGQPHVVSKRFTASLHEKSALRKMLASWRGRDFTPDELKAFDTRAVLGKTCLISLVESIKDGTNYTNIAGIMAAPKAMQPPEGTCNESLLHWDMAAPDWVTFAALPKRVQEQIEASPEFKALTPPSGRIALSASQPSPAPATAKPTRTPTPPPAQAADGLDDFESDIPF
ncbi:hypothetical protein C5F52_10915 [Limnohabitans sp. TS-CS-82]|uniref:phage replication initiation protein, NGO0469 family n=1 Tax=Limnohabitans sp. TS-CS-82 TaxID=2094193 RepID=UPI000CF25796|nr:hypothetical protein [Limnohabitans sp. TS-CS-82]PQA83205.1 hypothetical protein C5F52_10915 [Limnohabitans sp. TS-CS-82]